MFLKGHERHKHEKPAVTELLNAMYLEREDIEDGTDFCL